MEGVSEGWGLEGQTALGECGASRSRMEDRAMLKLVTAEFREQEYAIESPQYRTPLSEFTSMWPSMSGSMV